MATLNGKKVNNATYINEDVVNAYLSAGADPATGKPTRKTGGLYKALEKLININDEQAAINTFEWYNLPKGLTADLIERILYYRGQGMFFKKGDKFYFLPFALGSKGIDVYGRFRNTTPLPFNGTTEDKDEKAWVKGLEFDVLYDIADESLENEYICVLISDFSKQISQTNIARKILNAPLITLEAQMLPYAKTNLMNGTGVSGMRIKNEDEKSEVLAASAQIDSAALNGRKYIPIVGATEFQDLTNGSLANVEQYFMAMQSIDNFRLSTHGKENGGIFQKQAHLLESENALNSEKTSYVLKDRLRNRQVACDIINSVFNLGIWCDIPVEEYEEYIEETEEEEEPDEGTEGDEINVE